MLIPTVARRRRPVPNRAVEAVPGRVECLIPPARPWNSRNHKIKWRLAATYKTELCRRWVLDHGLRLYKLDHAPVSRLAVSRSFLCFRDECPPNDKSGTRIQVRIGLKGWWGAPHTKSRYICTLATVLQETGGQTRNVRTSLSMCDMALAPSPSPDGCISEGRLLEPSPSPGCCIIEGRLGDDCCSWGSCGSCCCAITDCRRGEGCWGGVNIEWRLGCSDAPIFNARSAGKGSDCARWGDTISKIVVISAVGDT